MSAGDVCHHLPSSVLHFHRLLISDLGVMMSSYLSCSFWSHLAATIWMDPADAYYSDDFSIGYDVESMVHAQQKSLRRHMGRVSFISGESYCTDLSSSPALTGYNESVVYGTNRDVNETATGQIKDDFYYPDANDNLLTTTQTPINAIWVPMANAHKVEHGSESDCRHDLC
ncbi:hypothetical protein DOTSEDRAFT_37297 [Dothistroma septosporum NZE10]|uniref:Uncharacterized protein n=1 Tax=Dothistroma septosporum (strain NZE10 / CBS 128990) TaxID=675120 RepID=N1PDM0_DOTSN|nr:hypothetical protein DOTSEDRAFT_37297 [Dothistroma septosporum NZE10]